MTNVLLDDALIEEAKRLTGLEADDAVNAALRLHVQLQRQAQAARELRGSFQWQGNLDEMRTGRFPIE